MALIKSKIIVVIVGGIFVNFAGLLMTKADSDVFGLSADFWAGFLIAIGVAVVTVGVSLAVRLSASG